MKIAVYGSRRLSAWTDPIRLFLAQLASRGIEVVMHSKIYEHLRQTMPEAVVAVGEVVSDDRFSADLAVSLGGDGTMLRTAVWVGDKEIPLIGFNAGHLGFLTVAPISELPDMLGTLDADGYRMERRSLLQVVEPALPAWCAPYALNEIALGKVENSSMITARVTIDGSPLADYRADGLIVCTATGSTAYNLSVGGPIVQPTLDVCVLAPVAAHSLSMRPMVVSADAQIEIQAEARASHVRLSLDSRSLELAAGTTIALRRAPFGVRLLQPADRLFATILRDKLHWAES